MTSRRELPEPLSGQPFAVREAIALEISEHRLAAGDLVSPFHGVRAPADRPLDLEERCRALATRLRTGDGFDGLTAVALWGAPLPMRLAAASVLHVSSVAPRRALRRRGVLGSQRVGGSLVERNGLPLLSPGDAWLTVASRLSSHDLVAVGDFLVTGVKGVGALTTREELGDLLVERAGFAGVDRARRALHLVREGAWSRPETLVRLLLVGAGLPEPELNVPLHTAGGGILIPDLAFPEFRVAVEYNGAHHDEVQYKAKDLRRMNDYAELAWSVVNIDRFELFRTPSAVVSRVIRRLRERGWAGTATVHMTKFASLEP
jgi:hypothetical protein